MRGLSAGVVAIATAAAVTTGGVVNAGHANFGDHSPDCSQSVKQASLSMGEGATYSAAMDLKATYTRFGVTKGKNDQNDGCTHMQAADPIDFFGRATIHLRLPKSIAGRSYAQPATKRITRSVSASFAADSRATKGESGTTHNGDILANRHLVANHQGRNSGRRIRYQVLGGARHLKVPASATTCRDMPSPGANWLVMCTIVFPYDTWAYQQPFGRVAGGFRSFTVRFALTLRYAGTTFHAPIAFPLNADS